MRGRLYDLILEHRLATGAALLTATLALCAGAARLQYDNSYRSWFVEGDPALVAYDAFLDEFGSDESLIVAIDVAGDPLSEATLSIVS